MGLSLEDAFDEWALRAMAGDLWFDRGWAYWLDGLVRPREATTTRVAAVVQGTRPYNVELSVRGDAAAWQCSCPLGDDDLFCKHCVAVALAMISGADEEDVAGDVSDLTTAVGGLDRDELERLVLDLADRDPQLRTRLEGLALTGGSPVSLSVWQKRVDQAFRPGRAGFVDYRSAPAWADGVSQLLDELEGLLANGHAAEVVSLAERAHRRADDAIDHLDDSDGHLSWISQRLGELHLAACAAARPDPVDLAGRLVDLELATDLPGFADAVVRYADVLGAEGRAEYRRIVEPRWLAASKTGDQWSSERFRTGEAMAALARSEGDIDALIAIRSAGTPSVRTYVEIIEALAGADRTEEAIDWGRRGVDELGDRSWQVDPLVRALADVLTGAARAEEADEVLWSAFDRAPTAAGYQRLVDGVSSDADDWARRAKDTLRSRCGDDADPRVNPLLRQPSATVLVEILVADAEIEEAWAVASEFGVPDRLWLSLADTREADHPLEVLPVYLRDVEAFIDKKNRKGYQRAVRQLAHVRRLSRSGGDEGWFTSAVAAIRERHKAKRTLIALLDEKGW